jgi:hypothetical protein
MANKKKPKKKAKPTAKKSAKKKPLPKKQKPAAKSASSRRLLEGTVVWMGLNTPDEAGSARFYREVLGLQNRWVAMGEQKMMLLSSGKQDVAHVSTMVEDRGPRWMAFFYVKNVDAAAAQAAKSGGKIQVPPTDIPEGRFCVLLDPHGIEFALFKPAD